MAWAALVATTMIGCSSAEGEAAQTAEDTIAGGTPIVSAIGGRCLDDSGDHTENGNKIQIWACNKTDAQSWSFTNHRLVGPGGKCLDIAHNHQVPGTQVALYECNGTTAQTWSIVGTSIKSTAGLCLTVKSGVDANGTPTEIDTCDGSPRQTWRFGGNAADAGTDSGSVTKGAIHWNPGVRIELMPLANMAAFEIDDPKASGYYDTYRKRMEYLHGRDVNHQIKGVVINATWADLENHDLVGGSAQYDGSWNKHIVGGVEVAESGFGKVRRILDKCAEYGWDLSIQVNLYGNVQNGGTDGKNPDWYTPSYLAGSTYGKNDGNHNTGATYHNHTARLGPVTRLWGPQAMNVVDRFGAMVAAYGKEFPEIYFWNVGMEMSLGGLLPLSDSGYSDASYMDTIVLLLPQLRKGLSKSIITIMPTWPTHSVDDQKRLLDTMIANHISYENYDNMGWDTKHYGQSSWGERAFEGIWQGTVEPSWPNHVRLKDWDFVVHIGPDELGRRPGCPGDATYFDDVGPGKPACIGSGGLDDIALHTAYLGAANVVFTDNTFDGPNRNHTEGKSSYPGPLHPDLMDYVTGTDAYAGHPYKVPSVKYPPLYPR